MAKEPKEAKAPTGPWLVVKARSINGRRRAGLAFSQEETLVPVSTLTDEQIASIRDDAELVVVDRAEAV